MLVWVEPSVDRRLSRIIIIVSHSFFSVCNCPLIPFSLFTSIRPSYRILSIMAAGPSDFFDPFFESVEPDSPPDHELPSESVDSRAREGPRGPGLYTTWDPQQLIGRKAAVDSRKNLLIRGQGTIAVLSDARDRLLFSIKTDTAGAPTLYLDIGRSECRMYYKRHSVSKPMSIALDVAHGRPEDAPYLWSGKPTIYWLSIDKCNGILRYGKHYTNVAHTLLLAKLKKKGKDEKSGDDGVMVWINPKKNAWLEGLRTVEVIQDNGEVRETQHKCYRLAF